MPPIWSAKDRLKIKQALAACTPQCFLSPEAVEELRSSTGLSTTQIKRCAENFRSRVTFGARKYYLACVAADANAAAADADAEAAELPYEATEKKHPTRYTNEVLSHLVNAMKQPANFSAGRLKDSTVLILTRTTHLPAHSIRRWARRYHLREGVVQFASPSQSRKQKRRMRIDAMKHAKAADEAADILAFEAAASAAAAAATDEN